MFIIEDVRVSFIHSVRQEDGKPVRGSTMCVLEKKFNETEPSPKTYFVTLSHGHGECYVGDQFNKAIGRKVALTRALESNFPGNTKEFRTKLWKKYFELTKIPR